jgi:hypothetical protein
MALGSCDLRSRAHRIMRMGLRRHEVLNWKTGVSRSKRLTGIWAFLCQKANDFIVRRERTSYLAKRLAPTTHNITAIVTAIIGQLTDSCSSVAARTRPKKGCSNCN